MICGKCKRNDSGVTVIHVRACYLANGAPSPEPEPTRVPVTEEGFYYIPTSGEYVKVLRSENSGRLYTKVWTPTVVEDGDGNVIDEGGSWEYTVGLLRLMHAGQKVNAETAGLFGDLYSRCVFCSRKLTDDRSIAVGYGPDCAEHQGLPWGEKAAV